MMNSMKKILLLFLLTCIVDYTTGQTMSTIPKGSLLACGEDKVLIIDPEKGTDSTAVIWSWSVQEAKADMPERYQKLLVPFDECKPIDNNSKILLTSSGGRSEEHTSELQSRENLVCRLLLEKKNRRAFY